MKCPILVFSRGTVAVQVSVCFLRCMLRVKSVLKLLIHRYTVMYSVTSLNQTPLGPKKWFSLERFPD